MQLQQYLKIYLQNLKGYIGKQVKVQVNDLRIHLKKLEKEGQIYPKQAEGII